MAGSLLHCMQFILALIILGFTVILFVAYVYITLVYASTENFKMVFGLA
jgi:hypothetical protein